MNKKVSKKAKKLEQKRLRELAADDYVDPAQRSDLSESDFQGPFGVTVHTSEEESRDEKALRSWARRQEENARAVREELEDSSLEELQTRAKNLGIDTPKSLSKSEIIDAILGEAV